MKKTKGLTLIEITIVLAIIAIVAAILIPVFLQTTDRARLRGDIQSAEVIQNAIDLYRVERGRPVSGFPDVSLMVAHLVDNGRLNQRNVRIQTYGARWVVDPAIGVVVDISDSPLEIHEALTTLSEIEQRHVRTTR
jgi:prepilin-type N-terminal cleavage/methylation domain-containing protein